MRYLIVFAVIGVLLRVSPAVLAEEVALEDFDRMTPEQFATRVTLNGDNLKADLIKTDERVGVKNLRITADIDPAKAQWTSVAVRFSRIVPQPQSLVFWYRGDKSSMIYLTLTDTQNQLVDITLGDKLPVNQWTQVSIPLANLHIPNAQPPNDHATLGDIAEVRIHPFGAFYPQAGTYTFQFDEFAVTTGEAATVPLNGIMQAVQNGGFEQVTPDGKSFANWNFGLSREAKATVAIVTDVKHSGTTAALFHDDSPMAPHVYSRMKQTVAIQPNTAYTLTAWVKGDRVGEGSHFTDWNSYNLPIPSGTYDWQQIKFDFVTKPGQATLDVGLNVTNITEKLWVDDVELRTDLTPLTGLPAGAAAAVWIPTKARGDDREIPIKLMYEGLPAAGIQAKVEYIEPGTVAPVTSALKGAQGTVQLFITPANDEKQQHTFRVTLLDAAGKEIGRTTRECSIFSRAYIAGILARAEAKVPTLDRLMADLKRAGQPLDYPRVSRTVVRDFIPWIREDLAHPELERALRETNELNVVLDRAIAECKAALAGQKLPGVPRYVTSDIEIKDGVFVADTRMPSGEITRRPVYFTGFGHFRAARDFIEKWPDYGVNVIQIEFGPSSVVAGPDKIEVATIEDFKTVLDRAEQNNVSVCLLLSPHYFPGWALAQWPEISGADGGFNSFDIDNPHARDIEEKFLRTAIPMLKGRKGLHSYCLSNEPIYQGGGKSIYNRQKWLAYLKQTHGELANVAKAHRAEYKTWDDVPTPDGKSAPSTPLFYDWVRFNDARFSGWHKWMADIIHEMDPAAKVHAKIMMLSFDRNTVGWGNDPEQFCELSQIAGNDSSKGWSATGEWANGWGAQNMFFDLLGSIKHQPIFNTENHVIWDRDEQVVPGVHLYNIIWQAAMHGEGGSTVWVWERGYDHKSDFWGSIMERPDCTDMHGRAGLDLMRLAPQVAAFAAAPAKVAIVYSRTSMVYSPRHMDLCNWIYAALNFSGLKVSFITEKQLTEGKAAQYQVVFAPGVTHLPEPAYKGLVAYSDGKKGLVVTMGEGCLSHDDYDNPRQAQAFTALPDLTARRLRDAIISLLNRGNAGLEVTLRDTKPGPDGDMPWGVEWRTAKLGGKTLVNLVNYTHETKTVLVSGAGLKGDPIDLISGRKIKGAVELKMLQPVLLEY